MPSDTPLVPPTLTPTAATPLAILVLPADLDPETSNLYQTTVYELTQTSGLRFQVRNTLSAADLGEPGLNVVISLPPDPGIAALAAAAPQVQFLAINIPEVAAGSNISVLGSNSQTDVAAFLAGYTAALITDARSLRLESIGDDPRSVGFPPHHPPMRGFLGVPIRVGDELTIRGRLRRPDDDFERRGNVLLGFERRLAAHLRVRAGPQAARRLRADVDLDVRVGVEQRLRIGVHRDELDAGEARLDHAVDRVGAAAADADDFDHCEVVAVLGAHLDLPEGQALIELRSGRIPVRSKGTYSLSTMSTEPSSLTGGRSLDLHLRVEGRRPRDRAVGDAEIEVAGAARQQRQDAPGDGQLQLHVCRLAEP